MNETMDALKVDQNKADAAAMRSASKRYADLAARLGPLKFSDRDLAIDVAGLNRLLLDAGEASAKLARALEQDERAQVSLMRQRLSALQAPMTASGRKLDRACSHP